MIDFVDSGDPFAWRGYVYAAAMFCLGVFCPVVFHRHLLITCQVGLRCKTALTSAIYRKALRLSPVAKRQRTTGEIVNLMSIDAQQVQDTVTWLHYSWYEEGSSFIALNYLCLFIRRITVPILTVSVYFLWQLLGPSCLAGLAYMFIVLPASSQYMARKNVAIQARTQSYLYEYMYTLLRIFMCNSEILLQKENMELKDERLKIMNQVLSGIKVNIQNDESTVYLHVHVRVHVYLHVLNGYFKDLKALRMGAFL